MKTAQNHSHDNKSLTHPLASELSHLQAELLIGLSELDLATNERKFIPCPISLTPWMLTESQFDRAVFSASALSRLLDKISKNQPMLNRLLSDYTDKTSLLYQLKLIIKNRTEGVLPKVTAKGLNMSRYDFLLNENKEWRLVESNAIAAGMGPFSEKLEYLQRTVFKDRRIEFPDNPAIRSQSETLYKAAANINGNRRPNIIFVVQENEDNIYDQAYLSNELVRLGATTRNKTLQQLKQELYSKDKSLFLPEIGQVDLFYFRTGYNLKDYVPLNHQLIGRYPLIELREWIERHQVVVAPNIEQQVTSSKWVQAKLSLKTPVELTTQFKLTVSDSILINSILNTHHKKIENIWQVKGDLISKNWVVKTQEEGGGNIIIDIDKLPAIDRLKTSCFLMEKIKSITTGGVLKFADEKITSVNQTISELGVFVLGEQHQYGGYLLRSKPEHSAEVGVHSGNGFLNLVGFKKDNAEIDRSNANNNHLNR